MPIVVILSFMLGLLNAWADEVSPVTEGARTLPTEAAENASELTFHFGHESNEPDGLFGPYTYGLRGHHRFQNRIEMEAGYVRLHEPGLPAFDSALDEAQFTMRSPERGGLVVAGTLWKNRVVDMYTSLVGLEVTRVDRVSVTGGYYLGNADRDEERGSFHGAQLAASGKVGLVDVSLGCLFGKIKDGSYRKAALEAAVDLPWSRHTEVSLGVEERYFNFGDAGTKIDPRDEFIYVAGLEVWIY